MKGYLVALLPIEQLKTEAYRRNLVEIRDRKACVLCF